MTWVPLAASDLDKFKPNEVTFRDLATKPEEPYIVLLGMPSSWSYAGISKGNKENVVAAMANLSIEDNETNTKGTGGSNKPKGEGLQFCRLCLLSAVPATVPSKPQAIGRRPRTAQHDNDTIESLRQELLGKINVQANDIRTLKSSNAELKSSNAELKSLIAELKSSNAELSDKVHKLGLSNTEMSSTLQRVS